MTTLLWIIAVVLAVAGVVRIVQGEVLVGIALLIAAALIGPGGVSIFT
jgi:hypothetical protein